VTADGRLRRWVLSLTVVVVFLGIFVPVTVILYFQRSATETELELSCVTFRANIDQLEALEALEHRLGIPVDFTIPPLPPECP